MSTAEAKRPALPGVMIAMTDLFVSATATLLVILVLSQTERPIPLPVQANLVAICPADPGGAFLVFPSDSLHLGLGGELQLPEDGISLSAAGELAKVLAGLPGPPHLFYTIGLAGTSDRPVTAGCLLRLQNSIVRQHNRTVGAAGGIHRAIAGVQVLQTPINPGADDE